MSRRPNVQRMRRAMRRDEAHRLRRSPEFRVSLLNLNLDGIEQAEVEARAWQERIRGHFPDAEFLTWRDYHRDDQVMRWSLP